MCHRNPLSTIPSCSFKVQLLSILQSNCEERLASSYQSVCLSVSMEQSNSHQIEFREISCLEFLLEFFISFRLYFKQDKNKGLSWRPAYIYDLPSYPSLQLKYMAFCMRYVMIWKNAFKYFLLPKITLYLRPRPSVCVWSRARILNLSAFPWNPIRKHFMKNCRTRVNIVNIISVDSNTQERKKCYICHFQIFW